jgi:Tfp pilus assembly protein PilN
MRAVNLLPLDARYEKKWWSADAVPASPKRILAGAGILAAVLALSLLGAYLLQKSIVEDRQATLGEVSQQVAVAEAEAAVIRAAQDNAQARFSAFSSVVSGRIIWEKVLRDLSRVLPPNAYLSTLTASSPTSSTAAPAGGVPIAFSVAGSTSSQPAVALVLDRLALLPWLSDVTLQSSTRAGVGDVAFTIGAVFNSTGVAG